MRVCVATVRTESEREKKREIFCLYVVIMKCVLCVLHVFVIVNVLVGV